MGKCAVKGCDGPKASALIGEWETKKTAGDKKACLASSITTEYTKTSAECIKMANCNHVKVTSHLKVVTNFCLQAEVAVAFQCGIVDTICSVDEIQTDTTCKAVVDVMKANPYVFVVTAPTPAAKTPTPAPKVNGVGGYEAPLAALFASLAILGSSA